MAEEIERVTGEVVDEKNEAKKARIEKKAHEWKSKVEETVGAVVETGKQLWNDHKDDIKRGAKYAIGAAPFLIKGYGMYTKHIERKDERHKRDYMYYSYEDHCWYELNRKRTTRINDEISRRRARGEHDRDILRSMGLLKY